MMARRRSPAPGHLALAAAAMMLPAVRPVAPQAGAPGVVASTPGWPAPVRTDTAIAGCSGGFTGGGGGVVVTSRGEIIQWAQDTYAPPRRYRTLRTDSAAAAAIFAELARIRFRSLPEGKSSNVTCSLELTGAGGAHAVSWPLGRPPAAVRAVYERMFALGREAAGPARAPSAGPELTPADTVLAGCTGGRTGGGKGVAVTGLGEISEWSQDLSSRPKQFHTLRVDSAAALALFRDLERSRFRSLDYHGSDDMTCFLQQTGVGEKHTVTWPYGDPPPAVRALYRRVLALAGRVA